MTVCQSQLRQVSMAAVLYADDNDDYWPYQKIDWETLAGSGSRAFIRYRRTVGTTTIDERPYWTPYLQTVSMFSCPLSPSSEFDTRNPRALYVSYEVWIGTEINQLDGLTTDGSMRVTNPTYSYEGATYDILASDSERMWADGSYSLSASHPASGLELLNLVSVNSSYWGYEYRGHPARGRIDRNFAHTDGSVSRLTNLEAASRTSTDSRLNRLPQYAGRPTQATYNFLPSR